MMNRFRLPFPARLLVLALLAAALPGCLVHVPTRTVVQLHDPGQPDAPATVFGFEDTVWFEQEGQITVLGRGKRAREHEWHVPLLDRRQSAHAHRWLRMRPTGEPGRWRVELAVAREFWPGDIRREAALPLTRRIQLAGETTMPAGWPDEPRAAELEQVELHHLDRPGIRLLLSGTVAPQRGPAERQAR